MDCDRKRKRQGEWRRRVTSLARSSGPARLLVERLESRDLPAVVVPNLTLTEGFPFDGTVATFTAADVQGSSYQATIAWGDGHASGGIVAPDADGFSVRGANRYAIPGSYPVTVTIVGQSTATGQGQATVGTLTPMATGTTITPVAGQTFSGAIASFTDAYPSLVAASYLATIDWGDGHISTGTPAANGRGGYDVLGTNTYAAPGTQTVTVSVVRGIDNQTSTATSKAIVVTPSLTTFGTRISPTAGQPFTGTVASFSDTVPQAGPGDYRATIDWGDGHSTGGTVVANGRGGFDVVGTNVYEVSSSPRTINVTIVRVRDGQTAMAGSTAVVANQTNALTGHLDPTSDTGVSGDGVTAVNQPTFLGTAEPFAIVEVFGRRSDQAQPVSLGKAIADASGLWHLSVGPLPDGYYAMSVAETPPAGQPRPMIAMTPGAQLTIDTAPPAVLAAQVRPHSGVVSVVLRDSLSGLNPVSASSATNYALIGAGPSRLHPTAATVVPDATVRPTDPQTVTLRFDALAGTHKARFARVLALGKVADLAGNQVPVESVKLSKEPRRHPGADSASRGATPHAHGRHGVSSRRWN